MPRQRVLGVISRSPRIRPRVAVLVSSYEGSASETKAHDLDHCTPEHYVPGGFPYRFTYHEVTKLTAHSEVRRLALDEEDPVHCFFNLVDGALEEDRAGVEVVNAMRMFNKPFTGPLSDCFEPNKVTMKLLVDKVGVRIPPFALLGPGQDIARKCRHLRFPVIVKHPSGFASVGITKDSKCNDVNALVKHATNFIREHSVALVEEFITGREGTVLVCRDDKAKDGVRVFPPIIMEFPGGAEDFQSFDNKWKNDWTADPTLKPRAFDLNDPVYGKIIELARRSYSAILRNVGYGRVDFRIDDRNGTKEPYFLEINPNCGMFYPPSMGGDYADIMVMFDKDWDHAAFIKNQIEGAVADHKQRQRWWRPTVDVNRNFVTKATALAPQGTKLFSDVDSATPVVLRVMTNPSTKQPSCIAIQGDDKSQMIALKHSCRPNLGIQHGVTLEVVALRRIKSGDILSIDYSTLRDQAMPSFTCKCGATGCRGVIKPQRPKLRRPPSARAARRAAQQQQQQQSSSTSDASSASDEAAPSNGSGTKKAAAPAAAAGKAASTPASTSSAATSSATSVAPSATTAASSTPRVARSPSGGAAKKAQLRAEHQAMRQRKASSASGADASKPSASGAATAKQQQGAKKSA